MDMETLLTKEEADSICAKIAKGLEDNKIVGSANVIGYGMKQALGTRTPCVSMKRCVEFRRQF